MTKVKMVAARPMSYATRRLRAGDEFDAAGKDARVLAAVGLAKATVKGGEVKTRKKAKARVEKPAKAEKLPAIETVVETAVETVAEIVVEDPSERVEMTDENSAPQGSEEQDEIALLAADYRELTGEEPDKRWRAGRLRREIDAVRDIASAGQDERT